MNPNLSIFLNISRWLAAFMVVIAHVRHLVLLDFMAVGQKSIFIKALYFATGLGHEAVVIFFVISGYLVGALTLSRWQTCGPHLRSYVSARVSRIYSVLIPALIVGLFLDLIGLRWFNASELYTNAAQYNSSFYGTVSSSVGLPTLFGNLLMMQNILVDTLGSNSPLWSLAYEWWYYCIFALVGAAFTGARNTRIAYLVATIAMAFLLPGKLMLWGIIWALGIAAHAWIKSHLWRPHPLLGIGIFLLTIVFSRLSHNVDNLANHESLFAEFGRDLMLGIAYVAALVSTSRMKMQLTLRRLNKWLAEFSYTTYLTHFPVMMFIVAVGYHAFGLRFQIQPDLLGVLYFFGLTGVIYFYCYVFSLLTERHTNSIRMKLDSCIGVASVQNSATVPAMVD